ncbi:MAG: EF-hand domain-containing protein, partial [archaeon]|nr:EF-hand domain-containing protein [archaeon]
MSRRKQPMTEEEKEEMEILKNAFDLFDRDHSGHINSTELGKVMKTMGNPMTPKEIDAIIDSIDRTEDNELSFPEFCRFVKKVRSKKSGETETEETTTSKGKKVTTTKITKSKDQDGDSKQSKSKKLTKGKDEDEEEEVEETQKKTVRSGTKKTLTTTKKETEEEEGEEGEDLIKKVQGNTKYYKEDRLNKLKEAFDKNDKNKDKKLDPTEMFNACKSLKCPATKLDINYTIKGMGKKPTDLLDFEEFCEVLEIAERYSNGEKFDDLITEWKGRKEKGTKGGKKSKYYSEERISELREVFEKNDKNKDDKLDAGEMFNACKSVKSPASRLDINYTIKKLGKKPTDLLDFDEFCDVLEIAERYANGEKIQDLLDEYHKRGTEEEEETTEKKEKYFTEEKLKSLKEAFDKNDKDKDGKLNPNEMFLAGKSLKSPASKLDINYVIKKMGRKPNDKFTYEEFCDILEISERYVNGEKIDDLMNEYNKRKKSKGEGEEEEGGSKKKLLGKKESTEENEIPEEDTSKGKNIKSSRIKTTTKKQEPEEEDEEETKGSKKTTKTITKKTIEETEEDGKKRPKTLLKKKEEEPEEEEEEKP